MYLYIPFNYTCYKDVIISYLQATRLINVCIILLCFIVLLVLFSIVFLSREIIILLFLVKSNIVYNFYYHRYQWQTISRTMYQVYKYTVYNDIFRLNVYIIHATIDTPRCHFIVRTTIISTVYMYRYIRTLYFHVYYNYFLI